MSPIHMFLLVVMCTICMATGTGVVRNEDKFRVPIPRTTYNIYIVNGCNSTKIKGHCSSRHHIVGDFKLRNHGDQKHWNFEVDLANNGTQNATFYHCYLRKGKLGHPTYVVVFNQTRDSVGGRCGRSGACHYKASDDAIYFSSDNFDWEEEVNWTVPNSS